MHVYLPPCCIVTLLRYVSIELKDLLTYLLTYVGVCRWSSMRNPKVICEEPRRHPSWQMIIKPQSPHCLPHVYHKTAPSSSTISPCIYYTHPSTDPTNHP